MSGQQCISKHWLNLAKMQIDLGFDVHICPENSFLYGLADLHYLKRYI